MTTDQQKQRQLAYLEFGESNDLRTTSPKEFDAIYALGLRNGIAQGIEKSADALERLDDDGDAHTRCDYEHAERIVRELLTEAK